MNYDEFLHRKIVVAPESGFEVRPTDVNPTLKPHQRDAVMWAVRGGRRALFESFGLGKTVQELEWCRLVTEHEKERTLIVLPLGVRKEFTRDAAELLGMEPPVYVRTMEEANASDANILMTNYERVRDGDIDPAGFAGAVLLGWHGFPLTASTSPRPRGLRWLIGISGALRGSSFGGRHWFGHGSSCWKT